MTRATVNNFPITTTDRKATEFQSGLCPALCGSVSSIAQASTSAVVSEYGIRLGIKSKTEGLISGINLGVGEGVFKEFVNEDSIDPEFRLKSIDSQNNRFSFRISNGILYISYNGTQGFDQIWTANRWVQGGRYQQQNTISNWETSVGSTVSGYSTDVIPICANVDTIWDKDIAIAKIGVKIPLSAGFPTSGQIIGIGTSANPYQFGQFITQTSGQISANGEWQDINYSSGMYNDQYEYFESADQIKAYTSGVTINGSKNPFTIRVWYDAIDYIGLIIVEVDALLMGGYYPYKRDFGLNTETLNQKYTVDSDSWSTKTAIPQRVRDGATFTINDKVYLHSGYFNRRNSYKYNPTPDSWSTIGLGVIISRVLANSFRVDDTDIGILPTGYWTRKVDRFDASTETWSKNIGDITKAVYGYVATWCAGYGWVYGGGDNGGRTGIPRAYNQKYTYLTNSWSLQQETPRVSNGDAYNHYGFRGSGCCIDNKNYFWGSSRNLGGTRYGDTSGVRNDMYDPTTDSWITKQKLGGDSRRWATAGVNLYSKGYIMGGTLQTEFTDSKGITHPRFKGSYVDLNEQYNTATDSWAAMEYLTIPRARAAVGTI